MSKNPSNDPDTPTLRERAEAQWKAITQRSANVIGEVTIRDMQVLLHELQVHQIELEMQNEELRRSQNQLKVAHELYVDLYDQAPVGYCTLSQDGVVLQANLTMGTILGVDRGTLVTQPIFKFFFSEDQDIYYLARQKLIKIKQPQWCELRMVKADGTLRWIHLAIKIDEDENAGILFRVVLSDINERKLAQIAKMTTDAAQLAKDTDQLAKDAALLTAHETQVAKNLAKQLAENAARVADNAARIAKDVAQVAITSAQELIRGIVDAAMDAIISVDADMRVVLFNPAAEKIFGVQGKDAIGNSIYQFIPERFREMHSRHVQAYSEHSHAHSINGRLREIVGLRANGEEFPVEVSISLIEINAKKIFAVTLRDITARKQSEATLRESELRFRTIFELAPDAIGLHRAGKLIIVNPAAVAMFGAQSEDEIIGKPIAELIHPDDLPVAQARIKNALKTGLALPVLEERYVKLDGTVFYAEAQGQVIVLDGVPTMLSTLHDVTERKAAQAKLLLASSVFGHAREGITITDAGGNIIDVNDAFTRITGYSRSEVVGQNPRMLSSGRQDKAFYKAMWLGLTQQGHWSGEIWNRRKCGEVYAELLTISAVRDARGDTQQYVALFSDISAIKEHQSQLEHIAHFDALTNLPNRLLLADRLQQAMTQSQRRGQQVAVVYLDLDGFKNVNDRHGHDVGDQLLIALATAMKDCLREGDTLARIGGDEFVAVLIDLDGIASCEPLLIRLLQAAADAVPVAEFTLQVSASLGITFYPQAQDIEADQLLRQADQAMYQAKMTGKNRYHVFDASQVSSQRVHFESL